MKQESDPVTILVKAKDQQDFHDRWERLSERLEQAQKDGELNLSVRRLPWRFLRLGSRKTAKC